MIHRMLRYSPDWEWHLIQEQRSIEGQRAASAAVPRPYPSRKDKLRFSAPQPKPSAASAAQCTSGAMSAVRMDQALALAMELPFCRAWLIQSVERRHNLVEVRPEGNGPVLAGTLMIQPSELSGDHQPLHFWVSKSQLVTWHDDLRLALRLQSAEWTEALGRCSTAPEAFAVLLSASMEVFHSGLDTFEQLLTELEQSVHSSNRTALLSVIFERRHDLLRWNHLFNPVREAYHAAQEAFMEELVTSLPFKRLSYKLERIDTLLSHYRGEIDTLIAMDDAMANFRGNDIMKTLTIFTALFLPATIAGALWGMNFQLLPMADQSWGFIAMCIVVIAFTAGIYVWLRHKGWTGDLLTDKPQISKPKKYGSRSRRPYPGQR